MKKRPRRVSLRPLTDAKIDMVVGMNVRRSRLSQNLTIVELGNAVGVTYNQFYKYEHGHNRISCSSLYHTSVVLGIPINDLFQSLPNVAETSAAIDEPTAEDFALAQAIERIPSALVRQCIRDLIETLAAGDV